MRERSFLFTEQRNVFLLARQAFRGHPCQFQTLSALPDEVEAAGGLGVSLAGSYNAGMRYSLRNLMIMVPLLLVGGIGICVRFSGDDAQRFPPGPEYKNSRETANLTLFKEEQERARQAFPHFQWHEEPLRKTILDVPGYLTETEIDGLTAEVKPGMTEEQISVLFGLQPSDVANRDDPNFRTWTFYCTEYRGHTFMRWFDAHFESGRFVNGDLFAGPL
jgi:hypothetical protein